MQTSGELAKVGMSLNDIPAIQQWEQHKINTTIPREKP